MQLFVRLYNFRVFRKEYTAIPHTYSYTRTLSLYRMKITQECIFYLLVFQLFTTAHFLQISPVYMQSDHVN